MENQGIINNNQLDNNIKKKNKSGKIAIAILSIFSVICLCFGIYGMFFSRQDGDSPNADSQEQSNDNSSTSDRSDSLNPYEERDLRSKVFRLLGSRNGFIELERYNRDDKTFTMSMDYMPINDLLSNSLTDELKVYITLETTSVEKDKYCRYGDDNVKNDVNPNGSLGNVLIPDSVTIDCISFDYAKNDYKDLFGEEMPKISSSDIKGQYGDYTYGANLDTYYYHIIGGRGGTSANYVVGKINQIVENEDYAKVTINAGVLFLSGGNPGELYSSIEKEEIYKTYDGASTDWSNLGLTDGDYSSFKTYNFVFKKNSDGIYSFARVE